MPPPLPSPPVTSRGHPGSAQHKATAVGGKPSTLSRRPGSAASVRRPPSVASVRGGTPRSQQNAAGNGTGSVTSRGSQSGAVPSRLQSAKTRGSSDKENGGGGAVEKAPGRVVRRQTSTGILTREKGPSKDGTTQRAAKEVEGLRNYVSGTILRISVGRHGRHVAWRRPALLSGM